MKLVKGNVKGIKRSGGEEYRKLMTAEYSRMLLRKSISGNTGGLEEVKLRLFLSLLDAPEEPGFRRVVNH